MRTGMVAPCGLLLLALAASGPVAAAQDRSPLRPTWSLGGGGGAFIPAGEFADHAGTNAAWELHLGYRPRAWGAVGLRLTAQFVEHGRSDTTYALPGIDVETRTGSELIVWTLGPELLIGQGPLRGLGHAGVGVAWARAVTSIQTATNDVGNTNHDDTAVAAEVGAALSWVLMRPERLWLELGGRWVAAGPLDYVPGSGIRRAAGSLVLANRNGRMDGLVIRAALGVALDGWARR